MNLTSLNKMELFDDIHCEWFKILKVKPEDYSVKPYGMFELLNIYMERQYELQKHEDRVYNKLSEYAWDKETWDKVDRYFNEKQANLKWAYEGLDHHFGFTEECDALDTSAISHHYCE